METHDTTQLILRARQARYNLRAIQTDSEYVSLSFAPPPLLSTGPRLFLFTRWSCAGCPSLTSSSTAHPEISNFATDGVHHWDQNGLRDRDQEQPKIQAIHREVEFVKAWLKGFKRKN